MTFAYVIHKQIELLMIRSSQKIFFIKKELQNNSENIFIDLFISTKTKQFVSFIFEIIDSFDVVSLSLER